MYATVPSQLSSLDLQDDAFYQPVGTLGVVPLLQTAAESPGESLVETGADRTEEGLDKFVGGGVAFPVNEFDEEFSLREAQLLHTGFIGVPYLFLHPLHVLGPFFFRRDGLKIGPGLQDDLMALLGYRQHFLDVVDKPVISHLLRFVLELQRGKDIDIARPHILNTVCPHFRLADVDHGHERGRIHIHRPVLGIDMVLRSCPHREKRQHRKCEKYPSVHICWQRYKF